MKTSYADMVALSSISLTLLFPAHEFSSVIYNDFNSPVILSMEKFLSLCFLIFRDNQTESKISLYKSFSHSILFKIINYICNSSNNRFF
jgi:hypothetical protein